MSKLNDFRVGDEVEHCNLGPGHVTDHDGAMVHVAYEGKWAGTTGRYDADWFRINPAMLRQRPPIPAHSAVSER